MNHLLRCLNFRNRSIRYHHYLITNNLNNGERLIIPIDRWIGKLKLKCYYKISWSGRDRLYWVNSRALAPIVATTWPCCVLHRRNLSCGNSVFYIYFSPKKSHNTLSRCRCCKAFIVACPALTYSIGGKGSIYFIVSNIF